MSTFEVTIYETYNLATSVNGQAKTRAKEYIEGAFSYAPHSVNVTLSDTVPDAPQEKVHESFSTTDPCYSTSTTYDDLGLWWRDYVQCVLSDEVKDCDLLLTAYDSYAGTCWDDKYAVAEGGKGMANLSSGHDLYGCNGDYLRMRTALHEFAHALMSQGTSYEHNVGITYDHNGTKARTPLATTGQNNECGNYVDEHDGGHEMRYSDCCESEMTHTY